MEKYNKSNLQELLKSFRDIAYDLDFKRGELIFHIRQAYKDKDKLSPNKKSLLTILYNETDDELYNSISLLQDIINTLENLLEEEE